MVGSLAAGFCWMSGDTSVAYLLPQNSGFWENIEGPERAQMVALRPEAGRSHGMRRERVTIIPSLTPGLQDFILLFCVRCVTPPVCTCHGFLSGAWLYQRKFAERTRFKPEQVGCS